MVYYESFCGRGMGIFCRKPPFLVAKCFPVEDDTNALLLIGKAHAKSDYIGTGTSFGGDISRPTSKATRVRARTTFMVTPPDMRDGFLVLNSPISSFSLYVCTLLRPNFPLYAVECSDGPLQGFLWANLVRGRA